jgi:hypothetical protein
MSINYIKIFNDHFMEFVGSICNLFPDDVELIGAKNSLLAIKRVNPKIIIKMWKVYVVDKYIQQIAAGDISFFIQKDYVADVSDSYYSDKIMNAIDRLRGPVQNMDEITRQQTMKYIQNLTNISMNVTI